MCLARCKPDAVATLTVCRQEQRQSCGNASSAVADLVLDDVDLLVHLALCRSREGVESVSRGFDPSFERPNRSAKVHTPCLLPKQEQLIRRTLGSLGHVASQSRADRYAVYGRSVGSQAGCRRQQQRVAAIKSVTVASAGDRIHAP